MTAVAKREPETLPVTLTPMEMLARAVQCGSSPETLEKLLTLQERWEKNVAKKAYDEAMGTAKAELPVIIKDKAVSFDASKPPAYKHETLPGIAKLIDPVLQKNGLSYHFRTSSDANTVTVTCVMTHVLGHSEDNSLTGPHDASGGKNKIQAVGSSVTYLQRYTLKAALGIAAANDDDAVTASEPVNEEQLAQVQALIVETGSDIARFCKHFKIANVAELPIGKFGAATALLQSKRK